MSLRSSFVIEEQTVLKQQMMQHQLLSSNARDTVAGEWVLYGSDLSLALIKALASLLDGTQQFIDIWKVGSYDVILVTGSLTATIETELLRRKIDYARVSHLPTLTQPGLLLMDMDSTAIQIECIDEIAALAGVGNEVAEVTERAMQGELDFEESLRHRVGYLAGAEASILEAVRQTLPLMPELEAMIAFLQSYGWKTAIASGGFTYFSDFLKERLSLDYAQSNVLEIRQGRLTGKVLGDVVSAQTKADILTSLATQYQLPLSQTIAIGDGANDLVMMDAAGLGVAFHAKPKVEAAAQSAIRFAHLGGLVCLLSVTLR